MADVAHLGQQKIMYCDDLHDSIQKQMGDTVTIVLKATCWSILQHVDMLDKRPSVLQGYGRYGFRTYLAFRTGSEMGTFSFKDTRCRNSVRRLQQRSL